MVEPNVNKLTSKFSLFIIPSWTVLLNSPTLGTYMNRDVSQIHHDSVIFFSGMEYSHRTEKGLLHYIFGLGYYSLKFELDTGGKPITDGKLITGLILTDEIYTKMFSLGGIVLEEESDIIIAENVIKVPVDLSHKSNLDTIKSKLLRNIFVPFKDIIIELMQVIQTPDTYEIKDKGQKLLSSHWDSFNQIIISKRMELYPFDNYMKPTAGLSGINYGADKYLDEVFSPSDIQDIQRTTIEMKRFYSSLSFNPSYPYSIFENISAIYQSERLKQEQMHLEQKRVEKERLEQERLEKERLEQERLEKERLEKERLYKENERLRKEQERLEQERIKMEEFQKEQEKIHMEREKIRKEKDILAQKDFQEEQAEIQDEFLEDEILKKGDLEARKVSLDTNWKKEEKFKKKEEKQHKNIIIFKEKSQTIIFKDKILGSYKFSNQSWNIFLTLLGMPFEEDEFNKTIDLEEKSITKLIEKHIKDGLVEVVITQAQKKKLRGDKHQKIYWRLSERGEEIVLLILDWFKKNTKNNLI